MNTISIWRESAIQPPTGNPFELRVWSAQTSRSRETAQRIAGADCYMGIPHVLPFWTIETGLRITLPNHLEFRVTSVIPGAFVLSFAPDLSMVFAYYAGRDRGKDLHVFAQAEIIEKHSAKVRFVEMNGDGGRIVRGDTKSVESSSPTGVAES